MFLCGGGGRGGGGGTDGGGRVFAHDFLEVPDIRVDIFNIIVLDFDILHVFDIIFLDFDTVLSVETAI
jgi:hypothetical protein